MVLTDKIINEKRELWLKDKTPEYIHGWKECEKGNPHRQYMYPEQFEQNEYTTGYSEFFAIQECSTPTQQESDYV